MSFASAWIQHKPLGEQL